MDCKVKLGTTWPCNWKFSKFTHGYACITHSHSHICQTKIWQKWSTKPFKVISIGWLARVLTTKMSRDCGKVVAWIASDLTQEKDNMFIQYISDFFKIACKVLCAYSRWIRSNFYLFMQFNECDNKTDGCSVANVICKLLCPVYSHDGYKKKKRKKRLFEKMPHKKNVNK